MLSVLEDLIPAKYRKYVVYILIPLAVLVYGVWKASNGDWTAFWPALVPAIIGWLVAAPNTNTAPTTGPEIDAFDPADQPDPEEPPRPPLPSEVIAAQANAVADVSDATGTADEVEE